MWLMYASPASPVRFGTVHELPICSDLPIGFWLDAELEQVIRVLVDIRRRSPHAYLPVFASCALPEEMGDLCDGYAASLASAQALATAWQPSVSGLRNNVSSTALALVRYLYLRPSVTISPVRDTARRQAYSYPLLEAFWGRDAAETMLGVLRRRGWIEQVRLVDRLRRCIKCLSVHLNYVDVCPACRSLDIEEVPFLHCFTCSQLAPQKEYLQHGDLVCPNCNAALKHIGVDYSRPLEQMHCRECTLAFTEARVVARCLACACEHDPEALQVMNVGAFALSECGSAAAINGVDVSTGIPSLRDQNLTPDAFGELLDWMLVLSRRNREAEFALVRLLLCLRDDPEAHSSTSGHEAAFLEFADGLSTLMRTVDLRARMPGGHFCILLPHTNRKGAEALLERISRHAESRAGSTKLEFKALIQAASEIPAGMSSAKILGSSATDLQGG